jgi:hypothetical protein
MDSNDIRMLVEGTAEKDVLIVNSTGKTKFIKNVRYLIWRKTAAMELSRFRNGLFAERGYLMGGRVIEGTCGACFKFEFPSDKHWRSRLHSQIPGRCRIRGQEVYRDERACDSYRCRVTVTTESTR